MPFLASYVTEPVRWPLRRSNRSVELLRATPLETVSSFPPAGESAAPCGPWKPGTARGGRIDLPTGVTFQPAGVSAGWRAPAEAVRHSSERAHSAMKPAIRMTRSGQDSADGGATVRRRMPATLRRLLPCALTVAGVAALLRAVFDPWYLNFDARFALLWARDAVHGFQPDYTTVY